MNGKNSKTFRSDNISDVHLAHPKTKTKKIIAGLKAIYPDNEETAALDVIFIHGDLFDRLVTLNDEVVGEIEAYFFWLLRLCVRHDIALRILEGTPSHDWKQSRRIIEINNHAELGCDVKYIDKLCIEYMERFDCNVLYIPDEWQSSTEKTLEEVKELLRAKGLQQVDIISMHGSFDFQLPPHVKAHKHDSEAYLSLSKYAVFVGHDHTHARYKHIVAQGSFDRLTHGQPEPKGHVRFTCHPDGSTEFKFIENKLATKYITIDCTDLSMEESLRLVSNQVESLPPDSHVRLRALNTSPIFTNMVTFVAMWPMFVWSKDPKTLEVEREEIFEFDNSDIPEGISITRENITDLLLERLSKRTLSEDVLNTIKQTLQEIK